MLNPQGNSPDPNVGIVISKEDYLRMFKNSYLSPAQIAAQNEKNRKDAIKELLQNFVSETVVVKNKKLLRQFNAGKGV